MTRSHQIATMRQAPKPTTRTSCPNAGNAGNLHAGSDDDYMPSDTPGPVTPLRQRLIRKRHKRSPTGFDLCSDSDCTPEPEDAYEDDSFIDDTSVRDGPSGDKLGTEETVAPVPRQNPIANGHSPAADSLGTDGTSILSTLANPANPLAAPTPRLTHDPSSPGPSNQPPAAPSLLINKVDFRQVIDEVLPALRQDGSHALVRAADLIKSMSLVVRYDMQLRLHTQVAHDVAQGQATRRLADGLHRIDRLEAENARLVAEIGDQRTLNQSTRLDMEAKIKKLEAESKDFKTMSETTEVYAAQIKQQVSSERQKMQDTENRINGELACMRAEPTGLKHKIKEQEADLRYWTSL